MQDNSVAYSNEYGVMYDSELLVSIAATVSSGNVNITATPEAVLVEWLHLDGEGGSNLMTEEE